jgi:hypothetical protein
MKLLMIILLAVNGALAQDPLNSYVSPNQVLSAKGYQIGVYGESFVTSKKIDKEGKTQSFLDGESFSRFQSEVRGYYGATHELQFGLGARFRQNNSIKKITGQDVSGTSTGLQSTYFNIAYAFPEVDQMKYMLETTFRYTPYTNEDYTEGVDDEVLALGDTGNEISIGGGMTFQAKNQNFVSLKAGYRRPGSDLSQEIYWLAEAAMAWKYVALVAGVDGVSSLNNDPYENNESDRPLLNTGSSKLYGSKNREWIAPFAGINFALGKTWRLELRGSQVVSGYSTDLGTAFGVNLIRRVDKSKTKMLDNKFKTYDLEATVSKVSPQKEYVVLDKGLADNFEKGMKVDLFEYDYEVGNTLVATGVVVKTQSDSCIVKISQKYNAQKEIKEGLIARTSLK